MFALPALPLLGVGAVVVVGGIAVCQRISNNYQRLKDASFARLCPVEVQHLFPFTLPAKATAPEIAVALLSAASSSTRSSQQQTTTQFILPIETRDLLQRYRDDLPEPVQLVLEVSDTVNKIAQGRSVPFIDGQDDPLLERLWDTVPPEHKGNASSGTEYNRYTSSWSVLGFQGDDPATDLRGGGAYALRQFVSFAEKFPHVHHAMIAYNADQHQSKGSSWFNEAVVSIQFTVQLTQLPPRPKTNSSNNSKRFIQPVSSSNDSTLPVTPTMVDYVYRSTAAVEERIDLVHARYMSAFLDIWCRHRPFVMEYQNFMTNTFFKEGPQIVDKALTSRD